MWDLRLLLPNNNVSNEEITAKLLLIFTTTATTITTNTGATTVLQLDRSTWGLISYDSRDLPKVEKYELTMSALITFQLYS